MQPQSVIKSQDSTSEFLIDYEQLKILIKEFMKATEKYDGIRANDSLTHILELISSATFLSEDTISVFQDSGFFGMTFHCLEPDQPTLLKKVLDVYSCLTYYSSRCATILRESGLVQQIADIFPQAPFQEDLLNSFIRLFTNISDDSSESRLQLVELGIFESICKMITGNKDPYIIQNLIYCVFSFFPQSRTTLSDEISSAIVTPLKSAIIRFIDPEDADPICRDKILRYALLTFELFSTSYERVHILIDEGVITLVITALPQLHESSDLSVIALEIISITFSTLEPEVLEQLLPLLDFDYLLSIRSPYICNIIEEILLISHHIGSDNPEIEAPVDPIALIEAGALDLAGFFIPDGDFKEKCAAAEMIAAITISLPESAVAEFLSNTDFIDLMVEVYSLDTNHSLLKNALMIIKRNIVDNEEIAEIFEYAGLDLDDIK